MTSYVMCNKKKLGIKKSDIDCLKKSVEDRKLEYFKSELLKILDKKEKEESGEEVSKAFIVQELYKSMTDPLYMAKGGKVGVVGEIRTSYKNKPPVVDRNPTINPSSVGGNGNVSALPDGNSNIAQDYTVVNKNDKENPAVKKSFASIVNELKKSYFDNVGA